MNSDYNIEKFLTCDTSCNAGREEVMTELEQYIENSRKHRKSRISSIVVSSIVAVVIFMGCAVTAGLLLIRNNDMLFTVGWTLESTGRGETKEITLPDSSKIWLNSSSQILYPDTFRGNNRQVFALGEIYADIAKDKRHPFILKADGLEILVHGTRFNVKAYKESDIREIYLEEGSVSLHIDGVSADINMQPSDLIRYDITNNSIEKYQITPSGYPNWRTSMNQSFINMTFSDIVEQLRRAFGVDIIVSGDVSTDTRYWGSFINGEDAFQILSALDTDGILNLVKLDNCIIITPNK